MEKFDWIEPVWPAPTRVHALITTRRGGVSKGIFSSMNLGSRSGDESASANRAILRGVLPNEPAWLRQVHGDKVVEATHVLEATEADASFTRTSGIVCAVLTADCLPVLLCDQQGTVVAAAHAGWRGLAAGILTRTVTSLPASPQSLIAYLGPAISARAFEVGDDVRQIFLSAQAGSAEAFVPHGEKWRADLYLLARLQLNAASVTRIYGGGLCTFSDRERFFSHRRDGMTGRMASIIWLERDTASGRL